MDCVGSAEMQIKVQRIAVHQDTLGQKTQLFSHVFTYLQHYRVTI